MLMVDDSLCKDLLQLLWKQSITGLALVAEDGRFLSANPSLCRLLEYTETELRRKTFQEVTDPEDVAADVEMARLVAAGEYETYDMTKAYLTKTRKHQPVLLRVTGLRTDGRFIFFAAEVAPIDRAAERVINAPGLDARVRRGAFLKAVKDYWAQITFALGTAGYLVAYVINMRK